MECTGLNGLDILKAGSEYRVGLSWPFFHSGRKNLMPQLFFGGIEGTSRCDFSILCVS